MNPVAFTLDVELSPNDAHRRRLGCSSDPKLHSLFAWRVDDKLFVLVVIVGLRENALDVGAVIKLSKAEAADVFEAQPSDESLSMFFST